MPSVRSILIALPSVYLILALVLLQPKSPRLPQLNTVPQRVLLLAGQQQGPPPGVRGGFAAPAPAAPAAPARALTPAEAIIQASPAPNKPSGTPYKVRNAAAAWGQGARARL